MKSMNILQVVKSTPISCITVLSQFHLMGLHVNGRCRVRYVTSISFFDYLHNVMFAIIIIVLTLHIF